MYLYDFPLDTDEAGAIGGVRARCRSSPLDEVWCADRRTRLDEAHRAHGATNLLVRTRRSRLTRSSSVGSPPAPLREQIDEW